MIRDADSYGLLTVRVSLGIVLLAHSFYLKFIVYSLTGTAAYFESIGLPMWTAYVVFITEVSCGILLIIGFQTRVCAALVTPILIGATWAHWPNGWLFTAQNGGWEYPLFLAAISISVLLMGPGQFSLDRKKILPQQEALQDNGILTNQ